MRTTSNKSFDSKEKFPKRMSNRPIRNKKKNNHVNIRERNHSSSSQLVLRVVQSHQWLGEMDQVREEMEGVFPDLLRQLDVQVPICRVEAVLMLMQPVEPVQMLITMGEQVLETISRLVEQVHDMYLPLDKQLLVSLVVSLLGER